MAYQVGSKVGVDLTQSQTAAQFTPGDRVDGSAKPARRALQEVVAGAVKRAEAEPTPDE